jgi:transposase
VQIVREYEYAYAAVSPHDGVLDSLVLPKANTEAMGVFLAERHAHEFIVMVLDGADWHRAKQLPIPANMRLVSLPPWSPPLNPAEHLWEKLREQWCAHRWFETMEQLDDDMAPVN